MSHNMAGYGDAKLKFYVLADFYTSDFSHLAATLSKHYLPLCHSISVCIYICVSEGCL
jgi:hypothetical protein